MAIVVGDDGQLGVGPAGDDPARQGHARIVDWLAWHLESNLQLLEALDSQGQKLKAEVTRLADRVEFLDQMVMGFLSPGGER